MGDNLKVVSTEFSTLKFGCIVVSEIAWHIQAHQHLELESQLVFCPVCLTLSMVMLTVVAWLVVLGSIRQL